MLKQIVILLSFIFLGCNEDITSDNFNQIGFEDYQDILYEAADKWCEVTNGQHCATFEGGENTIELVDMFEKDTTGFIQYGCEGCGDRIEISERPQELIGMQLTIMHELGHHFGCKRHLPDGNVMQEFENTAVTYPSAADMSV